MQTDLHSVLTGVMLFFFALASPGGSFWPEVAKTQSMTKGSNELALAFDSKDSYLTDEDDHNGPHLMFFIPATDAAAWGASLPGSPVESVPYWFFSGKTSQEFDGLPPIRIFTVGVSKWSDGTDAHAHQH